MAVVVEDDGEVRADEAFDCTFEPIPFSQPCEVVAGKCRAVSHMIVEAHHDFVMASNRAYGVTRLGVTPESYEAFNVHASQWKES